MFKEYDVVGLVSDLESQGLKAGTRGTIVMVYPSDPPEYEVEFVDEQGITLAIETVKLGQIGKTSWDRQDATEGGRGIGGVKDIRRKIVS